MDEIEIFLIVLFICAIIAEGVFLGIAYFGSDKVECNMLWCTFTTERSESINTISQDCFQNGERINCSEIDLIDFDKFT
jgi:hypothetical protein